MPSTYEPDIARLLAAFARRKHDRVPNFEILLDPRAVSDVMGWGDARRSYSWELTPQEAVELARRTHQDAVVATAGYGVIVDGGICDWPDLERISKPDLSTIRDRVKSFCDATAGSNLGVCVTASLCFFTSYWAMGPVQIQSFMEKLMDDRALVERIMDIQLAGQMAVIEHLMDLPFSFFYVDDDLSTGIGPFVSPQMLDELWKPRAEKFFQLLKRKGVPVEFHCCGRLTDHILGSLVELGVNAIHPVQPSCNDIYEVKKKWGDRLCLIGNMNIEGVLSFGTPDQVRADTREHISRLADGGYVCASSHSIVDSVPLENYRAMIDTAVMDGCYR